VANHAELSTQESQSDGSGLRPCAPCLRAGPLRRDDAAGYPDGTVALVSPTTWERSHTLDDIVTALVEAGLGIQYLHEHDAPTRRMFEALRADADRTYPWPGPPWLPLGFSFSARSPGRHRGLRGGVGGPASHGLRVLNWPVLM